jgi:biopolymer transport protein ExbB/TolQ
MDAQSFIFGILSGLVFIVIVLITIGVLKIFKIAKRVLTLETRIAEDERVLTHDINMVEQTVLNQIRHTEESVERHIYEVERHIQDVENTASHRIDELDRMAHSYVDTRIDKLEQKLKTPTKRTIMD